MDSKKTFFKLLEGLYVQFGAVLFDEAALKVVKGGPGGSSIWPENLLYTRTDMRGTVAKLYHVPYDKSGTATVVFKRVDKDLSRICGVSVERYELNFMRQPASIPIACSRADDAEYGIKQVWGFGRPDPRGGKRPNTPQEYSGIREDREPGTAYVRRWLDDAGIVQSEAAVWRGFTPIYIAIGGEDTGVYKITTEWTHDVSVAIKAAPVAMDYAEIPQALKVWAMKNLRAREQAATQAEKV